MIRESIRFYMEANSISCACLGKHLGIHSNSIRHFFKMKNQNCFKIIDWYLKSNTGVPKWKKKVLCNAIDSGESKEDIKAYINSL